MIFISFPWRTIPYNHLNVLFYDLGSAGGKEMGYHWESYRRKPFLLTYQSGKGFCRCKGSSMYEILESKSLEV